MLKKLLPVIVVLLVLSAAVSGYAARPWIDSRLVDYPVIQPNALRAVETYEHVAEALADYSAYQESIDLVVLEYDSIATKIANARLRAIMRDDWRYDVIAKFEDAFSVRVINLKAEDNVATIQLYFGGNAAPSSEEELTARLEVTAFATQLMAEYYPAHTLDVQWVDVKPYQCLDQCVRATVGVSIKAPAPVFLEWADSEDLLENSDILSDGGAEIFVDSVWTPYVFVEEELPRTSDDLAPWDYSAFYEEETDTS